MLVLDALTGIVEQDRILAERIVTEGRSCVIALNKWDAVEEKDDKSYSKAEQFIHQTLTTLKWAQVTTQPYGYARI